MVINIVGGIRALFLLLEQAVSRGVDLESVDINASGEFDLHISSGSYCFCLACSHVRYVAVSRFA